VHVSKGCRHHQQDYIMAERRIATCPTCKHKSEFEYLGVQYWPLETALALGLPAAVRLWSCLSCLTTLSEQNVWPQEIPYPTTLRRSVGTD
jgi:hypothetical protein